MVENASRLLSGIGGYIKRRSRRTRKEEEEEGERERRAESVDFRGGIRGRLQPPPWRPAPTLLSIYCSLGPIPQLGAPLQSLQLISTQPDEREWAQEDRRELDREEMEKVNNMAAQQPRSSGIELFAFAFAPFSRFAPWALATELSLPLAAMAFLSITTWWQRTGRNFY